MSEQKMMLDYVKQGESGPDGFTVVFPHDFDCFAAARMADNAPYLLQSLKELELRTRDYLQGVLVQFPAALLPQVQSTIAYITGEAYPEPDEE